MKDKIYSSRVNNRNIEYSLGDVIRLIRYYLDSNCKLTTSEINDWNIELFSLCKKDYLLPFENWVLQKFGDTAEIECYIKGKNGSIGVATEEDLFDLIEFIYHKDIGEVDRIRTHGCNLFGGEAQEDLEHQKISKILKLYKDGYELTLDGEILKLPDDSLKQILEEQKNIQDLDEDRLEKVNMAITQFRNRSGDVEIQRQALFSLARILENMKEKVDGLIGRGNSKEIFDLAMNYANNFDIRHDKKNQKSNYPKDIIYPLFLHVFLATYQVAVKVIKLG